MRRARTITFFVAAVACVVLPSRAVGQTATADTAGKSATVAFAERVAVRALRFAERDANGFAASRSEFTESGWTSFLKQFDGFLDTTGAPQFSSLFTPAGPAVVVGGKNGIVHVKIPGDLMQASRASRTTYRVAVDVEVSGVPLKVQRLGWTTCAGESARHYCM
jgi:hypothetical protein